MYYNYYQRGKSLSEISLRDDECNAAHTVQSNTEGGRYIKL